MTVFNRLEQKLRKVFAERNYERNKLRLRKELENKDFTILSANCLGGIIYHDLGEKFLSPTVNLYMSAPDFLRFVSDLDYYLNQEIKEVESNLAYPVGCLGNSIIIHFVHYMSFSQAAKKWEERKCRINKDNLFLVLTDRDDFSEELLEQYKKLNFPKILLSAKRYEYDFCIPCCFKENGRVGELQLFSDYKGNRYLYKEIDIIKWLNTKEIHN